MSQNKIIAFDVDDTLIVPSVVTGLPYETPNYETIALFKWYEAQGCKMVIWSGSGIEWAVNWAERLGLIAEIRIKQKELGADGLPVVDIAYDDCDVDLAKVNIKVARFNNNISRKEWNSTKRL